DPAAANRALARIRAEFGDGAVVRARLVEAHLPEARFAWEPFESARTTSASRSAVRRPAKSPRSGRSPRSVPSPRSGRFPRSVSSPRSVPAPAPADTACRPLVRRIHARPVPLPPRPRHEPDGWLLRGGVAGHVEDLAGPYLVSGGWWRAAVHREYYFARMRDGDVLWIYYDRLRRRWCWQGRVE
ncbi:MAG: hypothetical protein OXH69_17600, partial [Acidobacteria bacterium]|nr:hypothetical protein [Acidobacteriota bacterium]